MSRIQPQVPLKLQELVGDCGRKIPVRSHRKIANAMAAAFARCLEEAAYLGFRKEVFPPLINRFLIPDNRIHHQHIRKAMKFRQRLSLLFGVWRTFVSGDATLDGPFFAPNSWADL